MEEDTKKTIKAEVFNNGARVSINKNFNGKDDDKVKSANDTNAFEKRLKQVYVPSNQRDTVEEVFSECF